MHLQVLLPTDVLVDQTVQSVTAETPNGSFCFYPRHIDCVATLVPGLLSYITDTGEEVFLAVDEGILVKVGKHISISTRNASPGKELGQLHQTVKEQFHMLDERERRTRSVLSRMEAQFLRSFAILESGRR